MDTLTEPQQNGLALPQAPLPSSPPSYGLADMTMAGTMLTGNDFLATDMASDPGMHGNLFADLDLQVGTPDLSFFDQPAHPDHSCTDDPMQQLLLQPAALAYAPHKDIDPAQLTGSSRTASASSAASSLFTLPMVSSSLSSSLSSPPPSSSSPSSASPSPPPTQRLSRRRCQLSSSSSSSSSLLSKAPSRTTITTTTTSSSSSRRLPPRYPADPEDWRARLRYCEAVRDKGQLTAAMVRLLDVPDGLPPDEIAARRAGNLRLDRVREQRLKARNNSAAKRSRQRKVERIEAAEALIAALQRERAALQDEVARLQRALAAAARA